VKLAIVVLVLVVVTIVTFFVWGNKRESKISINQNPTNKNIEKPLDKYQIENLNKVKFAPSEIELGDELKNDPKFISRYFYFKVNGKRVSGQVNFPKVSGTYPLIVMFRGYIDREMYKTGDGTRRSSEVFTKNGFITVAPDFLGYGQSDMPSENPLEERFQTYITAATILKSVNNFNQALEKDKLSVRVDPEKVGIWGRSNGGQIALTVLEATGTKTPTVLWAPVSKPFPYSILHYTDDIDDHGKMLRKVVADFEKDYDSEKYSLTNYLDRINVPIQIHQGSGDEAVPIAWSETLVKTLQDKGKVVDYFTYPGDDHNFTKGSWQTVVERDIEFFNKTL
jgi:dipeptidyl aminopeptidase/acylaminoacyl peptidase